MAIVRPVSSPYVSLQVLRTDNTVFDDGERGVVPVTMWLMSDELARIVLHKRRHCTTRLVRAHVLHAANRLLRHSKQASRVISHKIASRRPVALSGGVYTLQT